jgi:hypothetical protein
MGGKLNFQLQITTKNKDLSVSIEIEKFLFLIFLKHLIHSNGMIFKIKLILRQITSVLSVSNRNWNSKPDFKGFFFSVSKFLDTIFLIFYFFCLFFIVLQMQESKILKTIYDKSDRTLDFRLEVWIFFKLNILEKSNILNHFNQQQFNEQQFVEELKKYITPDSHILARGEDELFFNNCFIYYKSLLDINSPITVNNSFGLGIVVKKKQILNAPEILFQQYLFGEVLEITSEEFKYLEKKEYPSLYKTNSKSCILIGPLSLVNHCCVIDIGFVSKSNNYLYVKTFQDVLHYNQYDEILVNYFNVREPKRAKFFGKNCKCFCCSDEKPSPTKKSRY